MNSSLFLSACQKELLTITILFVSVSWSSVQPKNIFLRTQNKTSYLSDVIYSLNVTIMYPCIAETKVKEPNFTLKRTFRVENTGLLPITIKSAEINGQACEGYGFKVLNCQEFSLKPNSSKDLVIL